MVEYANAHFETYGKDTDLRDQVLLQNPVLENFDCVKKLDDFLRVNCWDISQVTSKCQIYFLGKTCKKGRK